VALHCPPTQGPLDPEVEIAKGTTRKLAVTQIALERYPSLSVLEIKSRFVHAARWRLVVGLVSNAQVPALMAGLTEQRHHG
jgi:hypothetical protein